MSPSESLAAISRYLKKQHVLSLCCGTADDLWCANCFYVFAPQQMVLWIMTEANTRHGELMQQQPRVAGTVSAQTKTVLLIKGVQYRGEIRRLTGGDEAQARATYCQRFPVARTVSAPLWEIRLDEVKMVDNALGFGKKLLWTREAGE
ncbi:YhbP family protein [Erwinia sp. V71]|uniref:YhbP family protein n=1 Tax=Erwinia sp. V71 TaxID=3369424 RepID=UPI003F603E4A